MKRISAERWKAVRPALEQLLELPEAECRRRLEDTAGVDAELAAELRAMLALHRNSGNVLFLDGRVPHALNSFTPGNLAGMRLGNYVLDAPVGEGGMGTVWTATRADGHFDGRVAVKLLNGAIRSPGAVHRFMREGRLLARLSHPNIARLLDAGVSSEGTPYLVLEHVAGTAIDEFCDARRLTIRERVALFLGVLAAIEHSHMHLVVHRDIKPTNVLVTGDGVPKLLDFGIASLTGTESPATLAQLRTQTLWGGRAMTLQFAAPEQLQGHAATTRTDVYGLGVLLYLLLTGRHPTGLRDVPASAYVTPMVEGRLLRPATAVASTTILPEERRLVAAARSIQTEKLAQQLEGDLDNILLKALRTQPAERYSSVADFGADLRRFLEHRPVQAVPDSLAYRAAKFVRRHRLATAASLVALLAVATSGTLAVRGARHARLEAERAAAINNFVREMFGIGDTPAAESVQLGSTTVEQLLDAGTGRLTADAKLKTEGRVDLLGTLADMYVGLGRPAKAVALLEQCLALQEAMPPGSPLRNPAQVADTLLKLSTAAALAGLSDKRNAALDRAAPMVRVLRARAPALFAHWSYETSVRLLPLDRVAAATAAQAAAVSYRAAGDSANAVRAMAQQGFSLTRAERYEEARSVIHEAIAILQPMTPGNRELQATILTTAADLDFQTLRLRDAEQGLRDVLRLIVELKGMNHPMSARTRMRLARVLWRRGEFSACVQEAQAAVAAAEASSGPNDRRVLPSVLEVRARCFTSLGRLDEAIADYEHAAALWDPKSSGGLMVGTDYLDLAHLHLLRGDVARAQAEHARMLAVMEPGVRERRAQEVALVTAELRVAEGHFAEAVRTLEPLARNLESGGPASWNRVELHLAWSSTLTAAHDPRAPAAVRAAREFIDGTPLRGQAPPLEAELRKVEAAQRQATGAANTAKS